MQLRLPILKYVLDPLSCVSAFDLFSFVGLVLRIGVSCSL